MSTNENKKKLLTKEDVYAAAEPDDAREHPGTLAVECYFQTADVLATVEALEEAQEAIARGDADYIQLQRMLSKRDAALEASEDDKATMEDAIALLTKERDEARARVTELEASRDEEEAANQKYCVGLVTEREAFKQRAEKAEARVAEEVAAKLAAENLLRDARTKTDRLEAALREAPCKCYLRKTCSLCGDSTYDHACNDGERIGDACSRCAALEAKP